MSITKKDYFKNLQNLTQVLLRNGHELDLKQHFEDFIFVSFSISVTFLFFLTVSLSVG